MPMEILVFHIQNMFLDKLIEEQNPPEVEAGLEECNV